jgi:hypothetical protein
MHIGSKLIKNQLPKLYIDAYTWNTPQPFNSFVETYSNKMAKISKTFVLMKEVQ